MITKQLKNSHFTWMPEEKMFIINGSGNSAVLTKSEAISFVRFALRILQKYFTMGINAKLKKERKVKK